MYHVLSLSIKRTLVVLMVVQDVEINNISGTDEC
jgi:hypothetical protein